MADIELSPLRTWVIEFNVELIAEPSNFAGCRIDLYGLNYGSPVGAPSTWLSLQGFSYNNYYTGVFRNGVEWTARKLDSLSAYNPQSFGSTGKIHISWQGQDIYRTTDNRHHRIGHGPITVNGTEIEMPPTWEMPTLAIQATYDGGSGSISIGSIGPVGTDLPMRSAMWADYHADDTPATYFDGTTVVKSAFVPGGHIVNSADGKSCVWTGGDFTTAATGIAQSYQVGSRFMPTATQRYPGGHTSGTAGSGEIGGSIANRLTLMLSYVTTSVIVKASATKYPFAEPIVGMPVTLGYYCENGIGSGLAVEDHNILNDAKDKTPPAKFTDSAGQTSHTLDYDLSGRTPDNTGSSFAYYNGYTFVRMLATEGAADVRGSLSGETINYAGVKVRGTKWMYDNLWDWRTYNGAYDVTGQITLKTIPQIAVTRKTAFTVTGGASDVWRGIAVPIPSHDLPNGYTADDVTRLAAPSTFSTIESAKVQVSSAGGVQFTISESDVKTTFDYGVQRELSTDQGRRRAFRQFRWMRLTISADKTATARIVLQSKKGHTRQDGDYEAATAAWNVALKPGSNVLDLDMMRGGVYPFWTSFPNPPQIRGVIPAWQRGPMASTNEYDQLGEFVLRGYEAGPDTQWFENDVWYIRVDKIVPGVTYTLQDIELKDRTDGARSALRVFAAPMGLASSPDAGKNAPLMMQALGVSVNGRRVLSAPNVTTTGGLDIEATFSKLITRWQDTIDAGSGCWTLTPLNTDLIHTTSLDQIGPPADVTDTGFTIYSRVQTTALGFLPGYDKTVSPEIHVLFELGQLVDGVVFNAVTRTALADKQLTSTCTRPANTPPKTLATVTTDDDGYFAFGGVPHPGDEVLQSDGERVVYTTTPIQFAEAEDPTFAKWSLLGRQPVGQSNGNEFTFVVLAIAPLVGTEQDLAQDISHGRIYRIFSDPDTKSLTIQVHDGHKGLSGDPIRTNTLHTKTGAVVAGNSPSIWIASHEGHAVAAYQRPSDTQCVISWSDDGLLTIGAEMDLFDAPGALPMLVQDHSTGIVYVFGAFIDGAAASVSLIRLDSTKKLMKWADGATEKVVAVGLVAAGRPAAIINRFDKEQTLLMQYGDAKYQSLDGGENWDVVT